MNEMKLEGEEQILQDEAKVWKLINDTAFSGFQEDSFLVCNVDVIRRNFSKWISEFKPAAPSFDVGINCNPFVLHTLNDLGCHFVCKNKEEMKIALEIGVSVEKIRFQSEMLVSSHLKFAQASNIRTVGFKNVSDLNKIRRYAPVSNLVIVLNASSTEDEILHLLNEASLAEMKVTGISIRKEVDGLHKTVLATLRRGKQMGHFHSQFAVVDLGKCAFNEFNEKLALNEGTELKITVDSENLLLNNAFTLAARITKKRGSFQDDGNPNFTYFLNDGVFGSFGHLMFEENEDSLSPEPLILDYEDNKKRRTELLGPTGDGLDVLGSDFRLPEMDVGDWIIFPNAGIFSMKEHHNFEVPNEFSSDPEMRLFYKLTEDEELDDNVGGIEFERANNSCQNFGFDDLLQEMTNLSSYHNL